MHAAVQSWQPEGKGVVVRTAKGVYSADKLVLTAGAWLPEIVPQLQVRRSVGFRQQAGRR